MKTIASFRGPYLAHLAKGRLDAEGIPAVIIDEHIVYMNWLYSDAVGGVKVQVPQSNLERARLILEKDYFEDVSATAEGQLDPTPEEICPKCSYILDFTTSLFDLVIDSVTHLFSAHFLSWKEMGM